MSNSNPLREALVTVNANGEFSLTVNDHLLSGPPVTGGDKLVTSFGIRRSVIEKALESPLREPTVSEAHLVDVCFDIDDGAGDTIRLHTMKMARVPSALEIVKLNGPAFGDGHHEDYTYFRVQSVEWDIDASGGALEPKYCAVVFLELHETESANRWKPNCTCPNRLEGDGGGTCNNCDLGRPIKGHREGSHFR